MRGRRSLESREHILECTTQRTVTRTATSSFEGKSGANYIHYIQILHHSSKISIYNVYTGCDKWSKLRTLYTLYIDITSFFEGKSGAQRFTYNIHIICMRHVSYTGHASCLSYVPQIAQKRELLMKQIYIHDIVFTQHSTINTHTCIMYQWSKQIYIHYIYIDATRP